MRFLRKRRQQGDTSVGISFVGPGTRTRQSFDRSLNELSGILQAMGNDVVQSLNQALQVWQTDDLILAREDVSSDYRINQERIELEERCTQLIAMQAPVARDLRRILAALTIATELERMGDHAKKIANIRLKSPQVAHLPMVPEVVAMGQPVVQILTLALAAFSSLDVQAVRSITAEEDEIDNRYRTIMNLLYAHIIAHPDEAAAVMSLQRVAHKLERIGDRATNIAEQVLYVAHARLIETN